MAPIFKAIKVHLEISSRKIESINMYFTSPTLAQKYGQILGPQGKFLSIKDSQVILHLSPAVRSIDYSQTEGGFVLHFFTEAAAADWQDVICTGIKGFPKQVCIRQYWEEGQLDEVLESASRGRTGVKAADGQNRDSDPYKADVDRRRNAYGRSKPSASPPGPPKASRKD